MHCGKRVCFHGAFRSKQMAKVKERQVNGFIRRITVRGDVRYVVMSGKATSRYKKQLHG